jgi:hypothetical protein
VVTTYFCRRRAPPGRTEWSVGPPRGPGLKARPLSLPRVYRVESSPARRSVPKRKKPPGCTVMSLGPGAGIGSDCLWPDSITIKAGWAENLTAEIPQELWVARELLSCDPSQAVKTRYVRGTNVPRRTWSDYCRDIGVDRRTANRQLATYRGEEKERPDKASGVCRAAGIVSPCREDDHGSVTSILQTPETCRELQCFGSFGERSPRLL